MTAEHQAAYKARQIAADPDAWSAKRVQVELRWRAANREKARAWSVVYRAVKSGRLIRPEACGRCDQPCQPQASHDDYSRQLDVEWLCPKCHKQKDQARLTRTPSRISECKRGHAYSEENTYSPSPGVRLCRACRRGHVRAYQQRKRDQQLKRRLSDD